MFIVLFEVVLCTVIEFGSIFVCGLLSIVGLIAIELLLLSIMGVTRALVILS